MSATPSPAPGPPHPEPPPPPSHHPTHEPPRHPDPPPPHGHRPPQGEAVGCLPAVVFLLALACGAGLFVLRSELLPKEDAGRTVIEIMDAPTAAEMKAHVRRITSGEVLKLGLKNLNPPNQLELPGVWEERLNRLTDNVVASAKGPFITITAFGSQHPPAALAHDVAQAYSEFLKDAIEQDRRRYNQALVAHINLGIAETEKARLEWIDLSRKHAVAPDGKAQGEAAYEKELASRLAKARADLVMLEARIGTLKDDDPNKTAAVTEVQTLRAVIEQLKSAAAQAVTDSIAAEYRRAEADYAKANYDRQRHHLEGMRNDDIKRRLKESVVLMPTRIVEEAAPVQAPDRRIRKNVKAGMVVSGVLMAAFLLAALASRLARRSP
jgi:hypothetical protein